MTADELAGVVLGDRLQLVRPLGRAPQAWVWEAQNQVGQPDAERVAAWLVPGAADSARRVAELSAWVRTQHAYLLGYRAVFAAEHGGEHFVVLVSDPVEGSLRDRLDTGRRLSLAEAADLGTALSSALVTLHRDGQVHGTVAPEHIWWDGRQWRLGGLGLGGPGSPADDIAAIGQILSAALTGAPSGASVWLSAPWRALLQACEQRQVSAEWVLRELTDPDSPLRQETPPARPAMAPRGIDTSPAPSARQVAVAVGMLALLALIAIAPTLLRRSARHRVVRRQTVCMTNLKQLGLATLMYAQDWDGYLPAPLPGQGEQATRQLLPYTHNPTIYQCPTQRGVSQSYFYCAPQPLRLAAIPMPYMLGLHGEGRSLSAPAYPHNHGAHIAYADGHVKWIPAANYLLPSVTQWRHATASMPRLYPSPPRRVTRPQPGAPPARPGPLPPSPPR